jgi:hypothetical protein
MLRITAPHPAKNPTQHLKNFLDILSIAKPVRATRPLVSTVPIRTRDDCKVETISDRKQERQRRFGNQPENPARGYNSAKKNVPYMYLTCQAIFRVGLAAGGNVPGITGFRVRFAFVNFKIAPFRPQAQTANLEFEIRILKLSIPNPPSALYHRASPQAAPGGTLCAARS